MGQHPEKDVDTTVALFSVRFSSICIYVHEAAALPLLWLPASALSPRTRKGGSPSLAFVFRAPRRCATNFWTKPTNHSSPPRAADILRADEQSVERVRPANVQRISFASYLKP